MSTVSAGVAGDKPPALIERGGSRVHVVVTAGRVAGDKPPALIERSA